MLLCSSTWILIFIHDLVLDNMADIDLKCSGYKFWHLENALAGFYLVSFCFCIYLYHSHLFYILRSFNFCFYSTYDLIILRLPLLFC